MPRLIAAVTILGLLAPAIEVAAQDCRRNCRAGEVRDANGCCKAARGRRARNTGYIWVTSKPAGKKVTIGRERERTPALVRVATGSHTVALGRDARPVLVKRDAITNVAFAPAPTRPAKDLRIEIRDKIYFKTNKHQIAPAARELLDAIAEVLASRRYLVIEVRGHTDSREKAITSVRRTEAVIDHLINKGVESHRLRAAASGETRPLAPNSNRQGRARNRRVEFLVLK